MKGVLFAVTLFREGKEKLTPENAGLSLSLLCYHNQADLYIQMFFRGLEDLRLSASFYQEIEIYFFVWIYKGGEEVRPLFRYILSQ